MAAGVRTYTTGEPIENLEQQWYEDHDATTDNERTMRDMITTEDC